MVLPAALTVLRLVPCLAPSPSPVCASTFCDGNPFFVCGRAQGSPPLHGEPRIWLGRLSHYVSTVCDTTGMRSSVAFDPIYLRRFGSAASAFGGGMVSVVGVGGNGDL